MNFSIGQRTKLQKHRKRHKVIPEVRRVLPPLSALEMKIIKSYPTFGSMLDKMKLYGWKAGVDYIRSNPADFGIPKKQDTTENHPPAQNGNFMSA